MKKDLIWIIKRVPGKRFYILFDRSVNPAIKLGMIDRVGYGQFVGWKLEKDEEVKEGVMKKVVSAGDLIECKHRLVEYVSRQES